VFEVLRHFFTLNLT